MRKKRGLYYCSRDYLLSLFKSVGICVLLIQYNTSMSKFGIVPKTVKAFQRSRVEVYSESKKYLENITVNGIIDYVSVADYGVAYGFSSIQTYKMKRPVQYLSI